MSGGSFDYLYAKDIGDQLDSLAAGNADAMVEMLRRYLEAGKKIARYMGPKSDRMENEVTGAEREAIERACKEILAVTAIFRVLSLRARALSKVFHAVEWRESCDIGDDGLLDALSKWHAEVLPHKSEGAELDAIAIIASDAIDEVRRIAKNAEDAIRAVADGE